MTTMDIETVGGGDALAEATADHVEEGIRAALKLRGAAVVGFSGGETPGPMFSELARRELPWESVTVVQVDERVAPDGHADRNATLLTSRLLDHVAATAHLMPVTDPDLDTAATRYAELLDSLCGGVVDVVHLGVGADGHTASLVPGDPVLDVADRDVAVTGEYQGRRRMTLTFPAINRSGRIVWQVAGADRAGAVAALVAGGPIPAARVTRERAVLVVDDAAGSQLP